MLEYWDYVNRGMRILLVPLSKFIYSEMKKTYKNQWWTEVLNTFHILEMMMFLWLQWIFLCVLRC